jgi:hypothetical protein
MAHIRPIHALKTLVAEVCPVSLDLDDPNIYGSGDLDDAPGDPGEGEIDIVPTPKGKDNKYLRAEREKRDIRRKIRIQDCARLVCLEGLSLAETAVRLGVSYDYVRHDLWPAAKAAKGDLRDQDERDAVAAYLRSKLIDCLDKASARIEENAAYGAVTLKAIQQIAEMTGIDWKVDGAGSGKMSLDEVAREVAALSPMLAGRLGGLARAAAPAAVPVAPVPASRQVVEG